MVVQCIQVVAGQRPEVSFDQNLLDPQGLLQVDLGGVAGVAKCTILGPNPVSRSIMAFESREDLMAENVAILNAVKVAIESKWGERGSLWQSFQIMPNIMVFKKSPDSFTADQGYLNMEILRNTY